MTSLPQLIVFKISSLPIQSVSRNTPVSTEAESQAIVMPMSPSISSFPSISSAGEFSAKSQTAVKRVCVYDGREGVMTMSTLSTASALDRRHCPDTNDNVKFEATTKSMSTAAPSTDKCPVSQQTTKPGVTYSGLYHGDTRREDFKHAMFLAWLDRR